MVAQVTHEAENSRQHARFKLPVKLIVGSKAHSLIDWSVSGLTVKLSKEDSESKTVVGRLAFRFDLISTSIPIELEEIHRNEDQGTTGYRYINLRRSQISILHHVINAYLSGEIVDTGSVIQIVKKDAFTAQGKDKKLTQSLGVQNKFFFRFRQIVGALALLIALLGLLSFIAYSIYNRLFIVNSVAASVNAPVVVVRSPRGSYFDKVPSINKDSKLKKDDLLATLRLVNGGVANIVSPCDCKIISSHVPYKQFVTEGEPLFTLLPVKDGDLFIEAKFDYKDVNKLTINQIATIQFVNGEQMKGSVSNILNSESLEFKHSTPLKSISSTPVNYAKIVITPETQLNIELLGTVATVSIDSFKNN
jgi:alginate biosynthesis protein Alg44